MPARPPTTSELLEEIGQATQIERLLESPGGLRLEGRYLHWDELRHRTPPEGFDHRSWWLAIKLLRIGKWTLLPVVDGAGDSFRLAVTEEVLGSLQRIDTHLTARAGLPNQLLEPAQRSRFLTSSLIEEAVRSSQLEGAATTRKVAEEMIRSGRRPTDRSERMVLNNYRVMERVRELRDKDLDLSVIRELQSIVTDQTLDDQGAAGRLRLSEEDIRIVDNTDGAVLHVPPPAEELEERLERLCLFANEGKAEGFLHPVLKAIVLHFWLAYDHPFLDGNGRTARALFYWSMLRSGYWLAEFTSISSMIARQRAQYARAFLFTETDENDLTYFALYHLEVIEQSTEALLADLELKRRELCQLESVLRAELSLNHRQEALLVKALRSSNFEFTVKSHQTSHRVVYETARSDLLALAGLGLLEKRKRGRKFVFVAPDDLDERLFGN